jgi:hypothetical protein
MKALTLTQPWATLVATGLKKVETRSWSTSYRGPLAIHAARGFPRIAREFAEGERARGRLVADVPLGAVVAIARLVDVLPASEVKDEISALERGYGDYSPGRYAWMLEDIQALPEPIAARGMLGLWSWRPPECVELFSPER